jgi:energy-coupling factor transporter ATP-binding protein EcfA2
MKLDSISYAEFEGTDREWSMDNVSLNETILIVGKNASGKTRFLNVIAGLAKMLSGELTNIFSNGHYNIHLSSGNDDFNYIIMINDNKIEQEVLIHGDRRLLDRGKNGIGKIWAEQLNCFIDFEAPQDQLAAKNRRDTIQHPFFEHLHNWAIQLKHFQFGTSLGRNRAILVNELPLIYEETNEVKNADEVVKLYIKAFQIYKNKFDKCILSDMAKVGYDCIDVGAEYADNTIIKGPPVIMLYVKERDIATKIMQISMSQGMFRALSLIIHINYCILSNIPRTILIDDIGEGLDFERSQALIKLLMGHASKHNIQLIMTTNDRFVMNSVPLANWGVISRNGNKVVLYNYANSRANFDEFEELGLNNFEFFSTGFFKEGLKKQ